MEWWGRETESVGKSRGTLGSVNAVETLNQRREACTYVCVWSRGGSEDGEGGILYQVVRGSLTSESSSKGDVGVNRVDVYSSQRGQ